MTIRIDWVCPNGCRLRVPQSKIGKQVRCPKCQIYFEIPVEAGADNSVFASESENQPIVIDESADRVASPNQMNFQLLRAWQDKQLVTRFVAITIALVGGINFVPAGYHWWMWGRSQPGDLLPTWIYSLIFVATLFVIYAVFLIQVNHWSSLKSVSLIMLVFASLFGVLTSGLILGGSEGQMALMLGLRPAVCETAKFWSLAMMMVAGIVSYLAGSEAIQWQRIDHLRQIAKFPEAAGDIE